MEFSDKPNFYSSQVNAKKLSSTINMIKTAAEKDNVEYYEAAQAYELVLESAKNQNRDIILNKFGMMFDEMAKEHFRNTNIDWVLRNIRDHFDKEIRAITDNIGRGGDMPTVSVDDHLSGLLERFIEALESDST